MISNAPPEDVLRIHFATEEYVEAGLAVNFTSNVVSRLANAGFEHIEILELGRGSLTVQILAFGGAALTLAAIGLGIYESIEKGEGSVGVSAGDIIYHSEVTQVVVQVHTQVLVLKAEEIATQNPPPDFRPPTASMNEVRSDPHPVELKEPIERSDTEPFDISSGKGGTDPQGNPEPLSKVIIDWPMADSDKTEPVEFVGRFRVVNLGEREYTVDFGYTDVSLVSFDLDLRRFDGVMVKVEGYRELGSPHSPVVPTSITPREDLQPVVIKGAVIQPPIAVEGTKGSAPPLSEDVTTNDAPTDEELRRWRWQALASTSQVEFREVDYEDNGYDIVSRGDHSVVRGRIAWLDDNRVTVVSPEHGQLKIIGIVGKIPLGNDVKVRLEGVVLGRAVIIPTKLVAEGQLLAKEI